MVSICSVLFSRNSMATRSLEFALFAQMSSFREVEHLTHFFATRLQGSRWRGCWWCDRTSLLSYTKHVFGRYLARLLWLSISCDAHVVSDLSHRSDCLQAFSRHDILGGYGASYRAKRASTTIDQAFKLGHVVKLPGVSRLTGRRPRLYDKDNLGCQMSRACCRTNVRRTHS